jgi:DNA-binding response OmpR family regulator
MKDKRRALVVEDESDINTLIAYHLKNEGFSVSQVFDGLEAKRLLSEEHFNIVVLDIMLPGLDGFEICRQIKDKSDAFDTFIIVVSARTANQDKLYAHILGADCYLSKPFSVSALTEIVREFSAQIERQFFVKNK